MKCGAQIDDTTVFCAQCGTKNVAVVNNEAQKESQPIYQQVDYGNKKDSRSFAAGLLGFLFPLIGLILYVVWKDEFPIKSRSVLVGTIAGVILDIYIFGLFIAPELGL
jgi:uncharacterized membrane protein YvbJ